MTIDKNISRCTFDCPTDIHSVMKMKVAARKISIKDYLVRLIIKDLSQENPTYADKTSFEKQVRYLIKNDAELMKKLADR